MDNNEKLQTIPKDFKVKRVAPDAVLLQQDMVDEVSTYVCFGNKGLIDEILYRFLSAIADQQEAV